MAAFVFALMQQHRCAGSVGIIGIGLKWGCRWSPFLYITAENTAFCARHLLCNDVFEHCMLLVKMLQACTAHMMSLDKL